MLNYKLLNRNKDNNFQEIDIQDITVAPNKSFISGYCDEDYNIGNNKSIYLWRRDILNNDNAEDNSIIKCGNNDLMQYPLYAKNVTIQGKVTFQTRLKVYTETVYDLSYNERTYKYVIYHGYIIPNNIPFGINTSSSSTINITNNTSIFQEIQGKLANSDDYITIENDYVYIENNEFVYNGITYKANEDFYLLSELTNQSIIATDGNSLNITIFPSWVNKTKLTIALFRQDDIINFDTILRVDNNHNSNSDGLFFYSQINENSKFLNNQIIFYQSYKKNNYTINVKTDDDGNYVLFNNVKNYTVTDVFYAFAENGRNYGLFLSKETQTINGIEYYKAYYNNNGIIYVKKDNLTEGLKSVVDENEVTTSFQNIEIMNVPSFIINEHIYPLYENEHTITINEYKSGQLLVSKINNNTSVIYSLIAPNLSSNELLECIQDFIDEFNNKNLWFYFNNINDYIFNIYGNQYITSINSISSFDSDTEIDSEVNNKIEISFVKSNDNYCLTIPLSIDLSSNQKQEDAIIQNLFESEKDASINSIIDMEKDMYYPCINNEGTTDCDYMQNLLPCNSIIFNLHFRTRDLETWDIIENSSWFIQDEKFYSDKEHKFDRSDLLYFLKFTDKDVFNQKNKLKNSFLRLSFYDSPNPSIQNLLYYSTIFVDERKLFNKYIKNINTNTESEFVNILTEKEVQDISVNTEFLNEFNEEKRLSCQFVVDNMYQTSYSSDGFYVYLFRDFTLPFESRSIYMKVEFNHAGLGKTLQFMLPRKFSFNNQDIDSLTLTNAIIGEKKYEVVDTMPNTILDDKNIGYKIQSRLLDKIEDFESGFLIQDIYYQQYIEFKLIYDDVHKRFCYYLPFNSYNGNNMILNLFELKLQ